MLRMFSFVSLSDKFINEVFGLTMSVSLYLCEILKTYLATKLYHCTFVKYSRYIIREHTSLSSKGEGCAVSVIINLFFSRFGLVLLSVSCDIETGHTYGWSVSYFSHITLKESVVIKGFPVLWRPLFSYYHETLQSVEKPNTSYTKSLY